MQVPYWLVLNPVGWPNLTSVQTNDPLQERDEICVHATLVYQPVLKSRSIPSLVLLID